MKKMNFRTKLTAVFVAVSFIPLALVSLVSLWKATGALSKQTFNELEAIREIKKDFLIHYFDIMASQILVLKSDPYLVEALIELEREFENAGRRTTGRDWQTTAAKYDSRLKAIAAANGWHDIFLIDNDGGIVYTVKRERDLGMIIPKSELRDSSLGRAFADMQKRDTAISDFAPYAPSQNAPAAFMMGEIRDKAGEKTGYLAFQIPLTRINRIMQLRSGLGVTGESYLVGPDRLMRSNSFLDPVNRSVEASFANPSTGSVDTVAVREALAGKSGTQEILDYRGVRVLSAYSPVKVGDTTWALMTEIDKEESFASLYVLEAFIGVTATIAVTAVLAGLLFLNRSVTRPLSQAIAELNTAAEQLKVAAQQQLTSSTEQATAATQLSATMEELLRSSRQIKEVTAKALAGIEATNDAALDGRVSLGNAVEGLENIGDRVEEITSNMMDLGEKTHQMSMVLEIINELAEQTTILSYNATIEAAGAGEAGTRFSAVADQIMNLAGKAVDSTKEIRILIEDIQKSANKTVLVTEDGMKAVASGGKRISDTSSHFDVVQSNSEENLVTSKEVDMIMTQQTTSIDQASGAIKDIVMASEQVKSSSGQTFETAKQLLDMSGKLAGI